MKLFLVVCLLVCVSLCQGPPPSNCCAPPQMEGYVTGTSYEQEYAVSEYFYYDNIGKQLRADVVTIQANGDYIQETTLYRTDLNAVFITNYASGTCIYYNTTQPFPPACTPPNGETYDFTLGVTLPCRSYFYKVGTQYFDYVVERDSCIPISGLFFSQRQSTDFEYEYFNVVPEIRDFLVFTPPSGCTQISPPTE